MMQLSEDEELEALGMAVDLLWRCSSREARIAALRSFMRGLQGKPVLEADAELVRMDTMNTMKGGGDSL